MEGVPRNILWSVCQGIFYGARANGISYGVRAKGCLMECVPNELFECVPSDL